MTEANDKELAAAIRGAQSIGQLQVEWEAWRPPHAGWHASCTLRLAGGGDPAGAAIVVELSPAEPVRDFALRDGNETVRGVLTLAPGSGGCTVLAIDCHSGALAEQSATLCRWRACRACDHVAPEHGSAVLGHGNWLQLDWTITGSADACQKIILALSTSDGRRHAGQALTPQQPSWRQVIHHDGGYAELEFTERFRSDGQIALDSRLLQSRTPAQHAVLAELKGHAPAPEPWPEPDRSADDTVELGTPRTFASFTYPRALLPPSPQQLARRFFEVANQGAFQSALAVDKAKPDRAAMQAAARDFINPASTSYPGQYVGRIASLPGPMGRLHGAAVRAFLALHPCTIWELDAALQALLGVPVAVFLDAAAYPGQLAQLQDSLAALLAVTAPPARHAAALVRALAVCHAAQWLAAELRAQPDLPPPLDPHEAPHRLREVLQANAVLPAVIFPLPQAPVDSTVLPLGYADLKVIRQHHKGYRLGELAHVENVMRGETREEAQQEHRRSDISELDTRHSDDDGQRLLGYQGRALQMEAGASSPVNDLKREFDNLQKQYASDGLSVTVSGGWTDTVDGPATLERQAAHYARELLDRAASRVARRIGLERRQRTREDFSMQQRRRFQNETGSAHVIGLYQWIDEVYHAHIEHTGSRLILECTLATPAAAFIARNNALHGLNLAVDVPPWQAVGGVPGVSSAYDLSRDNYLALARRYGADLPPPPPLECSVNASLSADPPHPLATLSVPDGYQAVAASVAYAWSLPPAAAGVTPSLDVLVGAAALKIDPATAANPGVLAVPAWQACSGSVPAGVVAAGLNHALNISLACRCADDSPLFRQWQCGAYAAIMAAYRHGKQEAELVLGRLAACEGGGSEGRRARPRAALRQGLGAPGLAMATAVAPAQAAFELLPFFRRAVAWPELSFSYAGTAPDTSTGADPVRPAAEDSFQEFLQAASARLLLPVRPDYAAPMLFYLSSNGSFWCGEAAQCPVFEADLHLANESKALAPPAAAGLRPGWEFEVATSMLMLRQDERLPDGGARPCGPCREHGDAE
jgi:hypothetical protein